MLLRQRDARYTPVLRRLSDSRELIGAAESWTARLIVSHAIAAMRRGVVRDADWSTRVSRQHERSLGLLGDSTT